MKPSYSSLKPQTVFYTVFGLLILVTTLNLAHIPIVWVDEIGYLDPAVQWLKNGNFASMLWNVAGTEEVFAAQLPFLMWMQAFFNFMLGTGPWQTRVYEIIAVIVCIYFLYKYLESRYASFHRYIPLLICVLLYTDQFFYESLRSGRMEILGVCLLAVSIHLQQIKKWPGLRALFLSLLFLTHPAFWPCAAVLLTVLCRDIMNDTTKKGMASSLLAFAAPFLLYTWQLNFNLSAVFSQLITHGESHRIENLPGDLLSKHFWFRFCDYYRGSYSFDSWFQPWHPILNLLCLAWAVHQFLRRGRNSQIIVFLLLLTHLCWFIFLGPMKRYSVQLVMLNYIALPFMIQSFRLAVGRYLTISWQALSILALLAGFTYFSAINGLAFLQRTYRSPKSVLKWLEQNTPDTKAGIGGEAIGYYLANSRNQTYYLRGLSDAARFNKAEKFYYLTYDSIPEKLISVYEPQGSRFSERFKNKSLTYQGLKIYELADHLSLNKYVKP